MHGREDEAPRRAPAVRSAAYWEDRYRQGLTSGAGSYGEHADFKASFLNEFMASHSVSSLIDWGCGDGNQLSLLDAPRYLGMDVSAKAIEICMEKYRSDPGKSFFHYDSALLVNPAGFLTADMALSMEVIFHLTEDDVFHRYMKAVFSSAARFVVIYNTNEEEPANGHMRGRRFTDWIQQNAAEWELTHFQDGPDQHLQVHSGFYCFAKNGLMEDVGAQDKSDVGRRRNGGQPGPVRGVDIAPASTSEALQHNTTPVADERRVSLPRPTELRVLLGTQEIANQMNLMSRGLKQLGVNTFTLNYYPTYLRFPADAEIDLFSGKTLEESLSTSRSIAKEIVGNFDIYHFHFGSTLSLDGSDIQEIRDSGGTVLMQHHGSDIRDQKIARKFSPYVLTKEGFGDSQRRLIDYLSRRIDDAIVWDFELYQYVKDYYKRVHFMRPALDLSEFSGYHLTQSLAPKTSGPLRVAHAPTHRGVKGTEHVIAAIEDLQKSHEIELLLVEGVDHATALKMYEAADLIIDQLLIGSHGLLSLEGMALGKPVICYITELMQANYPSEIPIINANPTSLTSVLKHLYDNRDSLPEIGRAGRHYVEKYHSLDIVGPELLRIYHSAMPPTR